MLCDKYEMKSRFENGILFVDFKSESFQNCIEIKKYVDSFLKQLDKGVPVVVDITRVKYFTMPVIQYFSSLEVLDSFSSVAVIADNPVSVLLYSVFEKKAQLNSSCCKQFSNSKDAFEWVLKLNFAVSA